jgi:hypothetical protein
MEGYMFMSVVSCPAGVISKYLIVGPYASSIFDTFISVKAGAAEPDTAKTLIFITF